MTAFVVIDASFAFRLLVPGPDQTALRTRVAAWTEAGTPMAAPALWLYELTSAVTKGVHFGQLTQAEGEQVLALAQSMDVRLVPPDRALVQAAVRWTTQLQRAAAYDSFYLALAELWQCELWTADRRLYNAAALPWVCYAGVER